MITWLDLFGTAIFAITGGFKAVKYELDILGVLVLSTITGVGGGILRDVILGDTPPVVFKNEWYLIVSLAMGLVVFFLAPRIARIWRLVKVFDAIGLGTFTLIGAARGSAFHLGIVGIMFTGIITSCGGGIIRDILVREIPAVITRDFYATAAAAGTLIYIAGARWGHLETTWWFPFIVIAVTTGLRLFAMMKKISLPRVKQIPGFKGSGD